MDDKKNILLEASLRERQSAAAPSVPTVTVNGTPFLGTTLSATFGAICTSFAMDTSPDLCKVCANCADEYECLVNGGICTNDEQVSVPTTQPTSLSFRDTLAPTPYFSLDESVGMSLQNEAFFVSMSCFRLSSIVFISENLDHASMIDVWTGRNQANLHSL